MGRIDAGYCLVRNPFDARRSSRVSLAPEDVDFLVLWTRDPRPMIPKMGELDERGIRSYVQMTINAYPAALEPGAPGPEESIRVFRELSGAIGSRRVLWRYDPVLVAEGLDADFHRRGFGRIASALEGWTDRATLSLLDEYAGTASRLARAGFREPVFGSARKAGAESVGPAGARSPPDPYPELLADLAAIARSKGIAPLACAEPYDLSPLGIEAGACIDASLAASIWGPPGGEVAARDSGQRRACRCVHSVDIGAYATCPRGCAYCYASRGAGRLVPRGREDESL